MAKTIRGSDWLANAIASTGTRHIFFIDAMIRNTLVALEGLGVQRIQCHTEKGVAYMADGYARISGRPAFCFAQSVGSANMAAGLQDAWLARTPIVSLTGRKAPGLQHRNAYQEVNHAPLFAPVTKFDGDVPRAAELPRLFRQALRAATSLSPRPTHLDLHGLSAEIVEAGSVTDEPVIDPVLMQVPPQRAVPSREDVARAAAKLTAARRLAIVAGTGAVQSGAAAEVLKLAEILNAPVATSLGAYGIISTRHPLSAGAVGSYSAPPANQIVHEAELVLFIGCHTGDQVTHGWRIPALDTPVVQIDADPLELGRSYANTLGLAGDPKATLAMLIEAIGHPKRDSAFSDRAAALVAAWRESMKTKRESDESPIRVDRLCAEISRALPDNGILVADTGYSGIWTGTSIDLNGAGQTYLRAAGSLGWSFPASLGAKLAAPDRKVICFTGDGALYYHIAELETARRRNIATVTVVNNNAGFGQGWLNVLRIQGDTPGNPDELLRFEPIDFAAVARGFGVHGVRVEKAADIAPALADALAMDKPVVIDVATSFESRAPEPWLPAGA